MAAQETKFLELAKIQLSLEGGVVVQNCAALTEVDWKKFKLDCERVGELEVGELISHDEFLGLAPAAVQEMWQLKNHTGPETVTFMMDHELLRGVGWLSW